MISLKIIQIFADTDCELCEGEGVLSEPDGEQRECLCVVTNKAEVEADTIAEAMA